VTASRLALRLFLVPIGLTLAILAGILIVLVAVTNGGGMFGPIAYPWALEDIAFAALPILFFVGPGIFAAGLVIALVSEAFGIRSWIFYVAAGGATSWVAAFLLGLGGEESFVSAEATVAAGLVGGLFYWAVVGRTAGADPPTG
jgi:hypothetical protein